MNIGVIGVGHIGGTLAEKFVKAGHQVSVANSRGKEAVRDRKSTRLNSSHTDSSRMPSSA